MARAELISPFGEILRDIARGGIAGLLVGMVGVGVGGRIAMRLAALLVPDATGAFTENGNRIGDITLGGSLGLVLNGLVVGLLAGVIWVVVSPWIPGSGFGRALLVMPVAVGLGTAGLIDGANPDFSVLQRDPRVVGVLVVLVAVIGFTFALIDDWLDARLPRAGAGHGWPTRWYALLSVLGATLVLPLAVFTYLVSESVPRFLMGLAIGAVGMVTLAWYARRLGGRADRPPSLMNAGRLALLAAVILGFATLVPEVSQALG